MTEIAKVSEGAEDLHLGELDLTSEDFLDEVDVYIQANLEDEIVKEALKTGVDLRHYSKEVEADLLKVENASIQDYIAESQNIASLHTQIASCDQILQRMEGMLGGFQADLSSISSEIQMLQEQSIAMNVRLKNRQAVRGELSQFVDEMVVPEAMINHILDCPVHEREFLEQLHELNHKINFVKAQAFKEARSCMDVKDILEKLKIKAIEKIREFLLQKIYQFRKPMTNYQIPQNAMLKFRFFNEFLLNNERAVAKEIRDEYVETLSKIYYSYYKSYCARLVKLQFDEVADKDDLIAVEDNAKRNFFSSKTSLKNRSTVFTMGDRGQVLTSELEAPIIVPHAAQKSEHKYAFEKLFRSMHLALLDNCCREYLFICDFFIVSGPQAQDLFNAIMGKTLSKFLTLMNTHINECYDSIALFLCTHIVHRYRVIMNKREVTALDKYWETMLEMLHPRFEHILQLNIHNIRDCDPSRLGHVDVRPHYITRRYAEFASAIVGLNQTFPDERVDRLMAQMQAEVERFCKRLAAENPHRRDQLVFLINNLDMMLATFASGQDRQSEESKEQEGFGALMNSCIQEYIEETLMPYFGEMMMFVKECEIAAERGSLDGYKHQEKRVTSLVRQFNDTWKRAIESLNQEIMRAFSNFRNGTQILQGALTQLIQYYHRFQKLLSLAPFKNMPVRNELINIHHIMVEVKKHKPNF